MFKLKACLRMNKFVNTVIYRSSIARTAAMKYILDGVLKEPFSLLFVMPDNRRNDYIVQPLEKTSLMGSFLQQVYIVIFKINSHFKQFFFPRNLIQCLAKKLVKNLIKTN